MNIETHNNHGAHTKDKHTDQKHLLYKLGAGLLGALILATIIYAWRELRYIVGQPVGTSYFTVTGKADINTPPDIAEVTFTLREENAKVADAQVKIKEKIVAASSALAALDIKEADIKTENYNSYPKYEYTGGWCKDGYCEPSKQKIIGYEVAQSVTIKIRNVDQVGTVLEELGKLGISELSGPNFTIDNLEKVRDEARGEAIKDAQEKSKILADQLGVRIIRMTNFDDGSIKDPYAQPMMYAEKSAMGGDMAQNASNGIFVGEKKVSSQVSITYEVK